MSTVPNSPALPRTADQYAAYLRARAEEAISASVHHASLSQQYLTLSQKYAGLAEQAVSGNQLFFGQSVQQVEREATTGVPAGPIGVPQLAAPHFAESGKSFPAAAAVKIADTPVAAPAGAEFYSPPARTPLTEPDDIRFEAPAASTGAATDSPVPLVSSAIPGAPVAENKKLAAFKARRKALSLRKLLDRATRAALEQAERVRVKARKSDLKPQLRKTSEELKEELKRGSKPAVISVCVTILALFLLALRQLEFVEEAELPPIVASFSEAVDEVEESFPVEPPAPEVGDQQEQPAEEMVEEPEPVPEPEPEPESEPAPETPAELPVVEAVLPETPAGTEPSSPEPSVSSEVSVVDPRSEAGRKLMLEKFGGSAASESAVGNALMWLAARQRSNGTWDFIDVGPCTSPGTANNPIGGTAYALLPFLAAGHTHRDGQYKKNVQAGLEFLMSIGVAAPAGYDLRGVVNKADPDEDPNYAYYVHGAATLALCEAYGMTKDRKLRPAAEGAVLFLINSQDPRGGGWRYNPQQAGSTSATAIQLMALKAAEKAGLRIPGTTFQGVSYYLDSVAVDREGRYGYELEKKQYSVSVTSMALLSRMYLGWGRDDGDLRAGVALIDKRGPYDNMYYNYFATQVMKNWGGHEWARWNGRLRDDLIAWQDKDGESAGSWRPRDRDDYSRAGGRLLTTCLATLTLEVYYRYQPLLPVLASDFVPAAELADRQAELRPTEIP
jgi:outer membrane biosynthesis protein TonB